MAVKKGKLKNFLLDALLFTAGSLIFAISVNTFTAPNNIAPGGVTGAATMINYLVRAPIGVSILILNIPIFIWGFFVLGFRFIAKTICVTIISSVTIDITSAFLPVYHGDMLLTVIYGGVLAGLGLSLIFIRGGTTGGTDLAASLLTRKFRHLSMGRLILFIDFGVVAISALVYRNFESPLYAAIVIFISAKIIDTVLYGTSRGTGKVLFIISQKNKEIASCIIKNLRRGVTELKSRGSYSGIEGEVLFCAVRRQEVHKTYDIIHQVDPDAFVVVGEAAEISGMGFKELK